VPTAAKAPTKKPAAAKVGGISSPAVKKATGKDWEQWLVILDQAGAKKMTHPAIATLLNDKHGVGPWWSQMLTVGYEQARGMRQKHEKPDGFQIGGNKTINVSAAELFKAWNDAKSRSRWLPDADMEIRKATPSKSMRVTWNAAKGAAASTISVNFYTKGEGKSQVSLEHGKLKSAAQAAKMKKYWAQRLGELKATLES